MVSTLEPWDIESEEGLCEFEISKNLLTFEGGREAAMKNGYDHFMLKEIYEQPNGVKETLIRRLNDNGEIQLDDIKMTKEDLDKINKVYIVACGTAYHAGIVGKYYLTNFTLTLGTNGYNFSRDHFLDNKSHNIPNDEY